MKKRTGKQEQEHYTDIDLNTGEITKRTPEFAHMSLKPGIGARWLNKFTPDVYPHGKLVNSKGQQVKSPRYYDKLYKRDHELELEELNYKRDLEGRKHIADNTDRRLEDKEKVAIAKLNRFKRPLE